MQGCFIVAAILANGSQVSVPMRADTDKEALRKVKRQPNIADVVSATACTYDEYVQGKEHVHEERPVPVTPMPVLQDATVPQPAPQERTVPKKQPVATRKLMNSSSMYRPFNIPMPASNPEDPKEA